MEGRSRCAIGRFGAALGMTPNANYATWHGQRREGGGARQQLWWWCAVRILSVSDWYDHYTLGTWCWDRAVRIGRLWSAREVKSEE